MPTAFGAPISAPVAVADGRVFAGCEDGYLYIYGEGGKAALPKKDLQVWKIRSPLKGPLAGDKFNWYTNYGDFAGSNSNDQGLKPPLRMRWARRLEGTVKHLPVCGGGRLYTHTAEGQIIAAEQDTGRVLWRTYFPDGFLSFTSPLYVKGKLLMPQGGIKQSHITLPRCGHRQAALETALHRFARLESPVPAGRPRQCRHLCFWLRRLRLSGLGKIFHLRRHAQGPRWQAR